MIIVLLEEKRLVRGATLSCLDAEHQYDLPFYTLAIMLHLSALLAHSNTSIQSCVVSNALDDREKRRDLDTWTLSLS